MGRGIRIHRMEIAVAVFRLRLDFKWLWVVVEMKLVVSSGRRSHRKVLSRLERGATQMQLLTKTHQVTLKICFIVCKLFFTRYWRAKVHKVGCISLDLKRVL